MYHFLWKTRTTRMPAFWGYPHRPMITPTIHQFIVDPKSKQDKVKGTNLKNLLKLQIFLFQNQVKTRQSQRYKFKEFAKTSNFLISEQTLHTTHFLKLLDKMCKYAMDPASIVEDTERTRFYPQTDRQTDGQGETSISPFNFVERWV